MIKSTDEIVSIYYRRLEHGYPTPSLDRYIHTHTHTHTHSYIHINTYMEAFFCHLSFDIFTCLLHHIIVRLFICSDICQLDDFFVCYLFIHLLIYSFIHLFIHLFIYLFIYLFVYSFIHLHCRDNVLAEALPMLRRQVNYHKKPFTPFISILVPFFFSRPLLLFLLRLSSFLSPLSHTSYNNQLMN